MGRIVTTVTVPAKGRRPAKYVVAGVYGTGRRDFTDRDEATAYGLHLAYGPASNYVLAG